MPATSASARDGEEFGHRRSEPRVDRERLDDLSERVARRLQRLCLLSAPAFVLARPRHARLDRVGARGGIVAAFVEAERLGDIGDFRREQPLVALHRFDAVLEFGAVFQRDAQLLERLQRLSHDIQRRLRLGFAEPRPCAGFAPRGAPAGILVQRSLQLGLSAPGLDAALLDRLTVRFRFRRLHDRRFRRIDQRIERTVRIVRDAHAPHGLAQRATRTFGVVVRPARRVLQLVERPDDLHRCVAAGSPCVEEAQRIAAARRRRGHQRCNLVIERAKRLVGRVEVSRRASAFRLDPGELDRALPRSRDLPRIGEPRRARRIVAAHRGFKCVGARPAERRAMG